MKVKKLPLFDLFVLFLCLIFGEQLLFHSAVVRESVEQSLQICVHTLIPSLFCFMVLTSFLSGTGLGKLLSLPLLPLSRCLCLPPDCGIILLMSLVGGYPVGIKALKDAHEQKRISQKQLQRMSLFCICPAPSFVIGAVGGKLLGNQRTGLILYIAQLLAFLFLGLLTSITDESFSRKELCDFLQKPVRQSYSSAVVEAVSFSSQTMLSMCGYVVLFGVCAELLCQLPIPEQLRPLLSASLEISCGAMKLTEIPVPQGLYLLSFFLSFGGISVLFQLKNILSDLPVSFGRLFIGRLLHGTFSAVFTALLLECAPQTFLVFSSAGRPIPVADPSTPILTGCLIGMLVIFLNSLEKLPKINR